ncbi:hypothetical protein BGZ80_008876 [Entomortierella chlamydospora]|uniref:Uncharacterized protein n=1 Tax=Entomortierella chlamydospora TaxID=101097 RepID=A0A9P6MY26_9FUNG|nr:hypothetical protein BGZ80_008876 [Entomortierella chlamydospora]
MIDESDHAGLMHNQGRAGGNPPPVGYNGGAPMRFQSKLDRNATLNRRAVRLDIRLLCVDRPGTGYTDPFKASSSQKRKQKKYGNLGKSASETDVRGGYGNCLTSICTASDTQLDGEHCHNNNTTIDSGTDDSNNNNNHNDEKNSRRRIKSPSFSSSIPKKDKFGKKKSKVRTLNPRVHHTCLEAIALVDHISPGARFGLMGHSCGIYYIMHMVNTFPNRIQPGPITLLTPWVPFKECPDTTSKTFKFLKHVPRGLVRAVTSSINHLGSVIMSSSNALSGALSNKDVTGSSTEEQENNDRDRDRKKNKDGGCSKKDSEAIKRLTDPFIVQFADAFDKVVIPALVQDMNRQHSNGYNSEIQMCITDVGFDIADISLPEDITINAYCGHLDTIVPIEAAREMGQKCGWEMNEFRHSGHGGPRMSMYALEDYALGVQALETKTAVEEEEEEEEEEWSEKYID